MLLPIPVHSVAATFLAAAPADPTSGWLAYGPLGLIVIAFGTGWVVPGHVYKQTVKEKEALQKQIDTMYSTTMPAVEANTRATERAIEALSKRGSR